MGCGGSRADAIEPRYHESWTRETESTWLTNTDAEISNGVTSKNRVVRGESSHLIKDNAKLSGMEGRSCGDRGRQMVNAGTQCGKQVWTSSTCANHQKIHPAVMSRWVTQNRQCTKRKLLHLQGSHEGKNIFV
ncbi:brain and acute leukemia cytoplasmic protein-like isoform X2 [Cyprinus carpio]|uniref:Brain and acute leukemia cytoplasmic protein-like isoform X2 n=1 Tax=Cyprinus carpio TaxID=7962 RepID=A0A9Q9Z7K3_CYPCA|nr:brain and acute leukemia cytoplasmic protein-like isoform X2 [Cyprinus carpio]